MKAKIIIIDDESLARDLIKSYLSTNNEVEILCECENGFEGIKAIQEQKPDIVFLDVQMPKINGFEMLELIEKRPLIIFTTAFNEYAIRAFDLNAIDYLLKPFSSERFNDALKKAMHQLQLKDQNQANSIEKLLDNVKENTEERLQRVVVKSGSKIDVIPVEKIQYIEAQDDYVMIFTADKKYLKQSTMNYFEKHLEVADFVRIHRSYIVKIDQISQLELYGKESYMLVLKSAQKLPVSKSGYSRLKTVLSL
jgi:two-component system, LytTR family, response regulator